ncbi:MAG: CidA/LrgA family protein [Bacillota bacterium]|nr:CidA/LrgA family protein [Bacillota bacterium]
MNYLRQLALLLALWGIGEAISILIPLIPGAILGMLLLSILLATGLLKEEQIAGTGDFFLKNIALFFVPAAIGLMTLSGLSLIDILILLAVAVLSTVVTMVVTALVTHLCGGKS